MFFAIKIKRYINIELQKNNRNSNSSYNEYSDLLYN